MANKPAVSSIIGKCQDISVSIQSHAFGYLPCRCMPLNLILGGRGFEQGQIIEMYGPEGGGKSTLLYEFLAIAAASGMIVILMDQERCATELRLAKFGLYAKGNKWKVIPNFIYARGKHVEDVFDQVDNFLEIIPEGIPVVVGLDSVGVTTCRNDYDRSDKGKGAQQGSLAKAWHQEMRQWFARIGERNITIFALNHRTADFANTTNRYIAYTTPGGKAIKHVAHTRIEVNPLHYIRREDKTVIGRLVTVKTVKNKAAPPFQKAVLPLYFGNPHLEPEQDYAGTYDAYACLLYLNDKHLTLPSGEAIKVVRNASGWSRFNLMDPKTGDVYLMNPKTRLPYLHELKWQGEAQFYGWVYPQHVKEIHELMMALHFQPGAWSADNMAGHEDYGDEE